MGFLDKVTEGIGTVAKKSEEMLQVSKLKSQLSDLNKEKTQKLASAGQRAYTMIEEGTMEDSEIKGIVEEVKSLEQKIKDVEQEIENVQAQK
jgi:vacuolar-type H+-ATPase subunit I/STV1